jgi:predicted RNA binding protein YcfA (HicA-like mRNA interferase family)
MARLPILTGREVIQFLTSLGFIEVRVSGSHHIMKHPDGRTLPVPVHQGEDIDRGLLARMLREVGISRRILQRWLRG